MKYEAVIGLEVHAQLLTDSKIFCGCSTQFGKSPNTQTCPVCLGMPGVLPVLNKKVLELTLKTALATHCRIATFSRFARKNYFYPDLPKGYQISQYDLPIASGGFLEVELENKKRIKKIGLIRIHMEEDAGKLLHEMNAKPTESSYVDFNRTGVPLIEIVSEPDLNTADEAGEYLRVLRSILQYLEVCDGNMEQGSFRCDANISLRPKGTETLGTKVELKNMNSFRHVVKALQYEIQRQATLLDNSEEISQETRLWHEGKEVTESMRDKEQAHDYRYFPDPDLVPIVVEDAWIAEIKSKLPELPREKRERFVKEYNIPEYDARILTSTREIANYFEECAKLYSQPKSISNWIMGDILRNLGDAREIVDFAVTPAHLAEMLQMIDKGIISGKIAKTVFEEMVASGKTPQEIVKQKALVQVSDQEALDKIIREVLDANPKMVDDYRGGKEKLFGFFVGQVMKTTKGKANPKVVNEILRKRLED